ncbi:hypothetical protein [Streptomyces sp. NPDC059802]|uniref:hypothetical protein n=1 Tax=Streptomyces sp. NPDC059802 TaxID=3346952 RepID=UPI00365C9F99
MRGRLSVPSHGPQPGERRITDRIVVLDQGRAAESDTFEELLDAGGIFAELYKFSQDR